jgi:hemerythrin
MSATDLFAWSPSYAIGHDQIDNQHQELFKLCQDLQNISYSNETRDVVAQTLQSLIDYTQFHFRDEENLMEHIKFPHFEKHRKIHDELINKVENLMEEFQDGEIVLTEEVLIFLKNWLNQHIMEQDMMIAQFLTKK